MSECPYCGAEGLSGIGPAELLLCVCCRWTWRTDEAQQLELRLDEAGTISVG